MTRLRKNPFVHEPIKECNHWELLLVSINDSNVQIEKIRWELCKNLDNVSLAIPENDYILAHQWFTDTDDINWFIKILENIPQLNKSYLHAIKSIVEYNSKKWFITDSKIDNNTKSIIPKEVYFFEWKQYDYQSYIYKCANFLYDKYNFSCEVVWEFDWYKNINWYNIKTPYWTFTSWVRIMKEAPVWSKPWDIINVENEWFMIWEKMWNQHSWKECVVINAWYEHHSFNQRTSRIIVMYWDRSTEEVVPRWLKKLKTTKKKLLFID
jgi:hypothetical protein